MIKFKIKLFIVRNVFFKSQNKTDKYDSAIDGFVTQNSGNSCLCFKDGINVLCRD